MGDENNGIELAKPSPEEVEKQVVSGTRLLTAQELGCRLGYSEISASRTVLSQTNQGRIPCLRINARTIRYHWPTVLSHIAKITIAINEIVCSGAFGDSI